MATKIIAISLSLLAVTTGVESQFFDLFQGYQPFQPTRHTTRRPDYNIYPQENNRRKTKDDESYTNNDRQIKEQTPRPSHSHETSRQTYRQTNKRKHTTIAPILNLNFFTTPATTRKKNSNRRAFDTNTRSRETESIENLYKREQNSNYDNKNQFYDETLNNIVNDYQTTRATTTKRITTTKINHGSKRNNANTRPNYATTKTYYDANRPSNGANSFSTLRPGVRPANVDLSKPPITNKPPSLAVYPRPTDSSVIRFPEDPDTSPEVISGPDEDKMSHAEKRKYIDVAEKMCDKYKSLNVKKLEAIPLVPSPEPVRLNVSVCSPTNVPLVVGGKVVTIQEFPHMALLGWTKIQGGGYTWKCGGSLISDQYVLTAAHCAYQDKDDTVVSGAPRVVQLGSSHLDDAGALVMRVSLVVRHPKYLQTRSYYDIALVKLVKPVTFSEVVKPACLGVPPGVGEPIIATGWGRTEFGGGQSSELRSVSVPVWDINDCHQILGTSRKLPNGPTSDNQICAGEKQGGKDTCQGDSGGPAQIQDGCAWRVVAVTSVGRSCGAPNTPALYAIIHRSFVAAQVFGKGISTQQTSQNINRQDYTTVNNKNNANRHNERENLSSHKNNNDYILPENVNVNNNHKQNINKQDYINLNNNNNNRDVNYNYNHERGDNINLNNKNNNNAYIIPDVATNSNHRQNVNYNNNYTPHVIGDYSDTVSGEHNYYNQNKNYEIETPSPSHNKFHSIRSPDYIYNPSPHDNNRQYGGYNGNVNVNNNYDVGFPEQSYTVTEAPRFNNGRNWWQPY